MATANTKHGQTDGGTNRAHRTITAELADLFAMTKDHDVREAVEAWGRLDYTAAFDALDAAEERFESCEDEDSAETAGWLRDEIDAVTP